MTGNAFHLSKTPTIIDQRDRLVRTAVLGRRRWRQLPCSGHLRNLVPIYCSASIVASIVMVVMMVPVTVPGPVRSARVQIRRLTRHVTICFGDLRVAGERFREGASKLKSKQTC